MHASLRFMTLALLGIGLLAGTNGCELQKCNVSNTNDAGVTTTQSGVCAKSLKKFVGSPVNKSAQWASGGSLTISDFNGSITLVQGSGTSVSVKVTPVDLRAYDTPDSAVQADFAALATDVSADANGNVTVKVYQNGNAHTGLRGDLQVQVPDTFDGALAVSSQNGATSLGYVGTASSVTATSQNGDVSGVVGVPGANGGKVTTSNGSISMHFDAKQKFNVQAKPLDGGTVDVGNAAAAGCSVGAAASDGSQTVSCGGATATDPTYVLEAGGTALADVNLSF